MIGTSIPIGALPSRNIAKVRAARLQPVVQWRASHVPRGLRRPMRIMAFVHLAEALDDTCAAVRWRRLLRLEARGEHCRHVDIGRAMYNVMSEDSADAASS